MKKLAASSLALALWMHGPAEAQSPFFQPSPAPVQPAAASAPAQAPMPPGDFIPVRVHFGGALTRDGVAPVSIYLNQPAGPAPQLLPGPAGITRVQLSDTGSAPAGTEARQALTQADNDAKKIYSPSDVFVSEDACAPTITDPRFVPPDPDDPHRPQRAPRGYRWYTSAEFLQWRVKQQQSPVLLTIDGAPVTITDVDAQTRQGGRFTVGHWLDTPDCHLWGLEATFMFTGERRARTRFTSNGVVTLAHPFIDADTGLPDSLPVAIDASPTVLDPRQGTSELEASSQMWGYEINLRRELWRSCRGHLDFLFGYRQFQLSEGIVIRDKVIYDTNPIPLSDATVTSYDQFGTHNTLFAGQVGLETEFNWHGFFIDGWAKFALGSNDEVINIAGGTFVRSTPGRVPPPPPLNNKNFVGALYTQPSNIGRYEESRFTVMPEAGVNVGYQILSNWRISAGYNFLYLNNVVRPGDAIDTTITRSQIPQLQPFATTIGTRPAPPTFVESNYWAHGITVQMEIRY